MSVIDLRSDTITQPTPEMRQAIANAVVGDDVLGDDPTITQLEEYVADLLGKEAAVFMPSGTMTNQVAVRVHTQPGDELVLEAEAHIYYYEGGGPAALSGVSCRHIVGQRGIFSSTDLKQALRSHNPHYPPTRLVCVENTHNRGGGSIFPLDTIHDIAGVCRERSLKFHMDGARLWNACEATGISPADYSQPFDTISVCFSKGLGAPVGSALVGSQEDMAQARRFRKLFGGGMRQSGILAAAALYALQHQRERLRDDHEHAQLLARELGAINSIEVDVSAVETNIVNIHSTRMPAADLAQALEQRGVRLLPRDATSLRAVTSLMVNRDDMLAVRDHIADCVSLLTV